jgi:hypothetical protein
MMRIPTIAVIKLEKIEQLLVETEPYSNYP